MVQNLPKNSEIIFPEVISLVIKEILEKYKLYRKPKEIHEKLVQEMKATQTFPEKKAVIDSQPESRLSNAIREIADGKTKLEDFSNKLQEIFDIPPKIAKDMTKDIEKNILAFAKKVVIEKEVAHPIQKLFVKPMPVAPPPQEISETDHPSKLEDTTSTETEEPETPSEEKKPETPDIYREPLV